jgi:hypothetical protein
MKLYHKELALLFTVGLMAIGTRFYRGRISTTGEDGHTARIRLGTTQEPTAFISLDDRFDGRFPGLRDFKLFGDRMAHILRRMEDWRPHTFREAFTSGYKGRVEWWAAIFRVFVGLISLLLFAMGIRTAVVVQKQYNFALKKAIQSN